MPVTFIVNGVIHTVDVDGDTPLLWVLRDTLRLTGTKYACGIGVCGACTVLVNDVARHACVLPIASLAGARIVTIEGLAQSVDDPVIEAWISADVPQCGFCQPGLVMTVSAMLRSSPRPSADDIAGALTNICRCGSYSRIRRALALLTADQEPP
jgi:isoquinoline 1-oxidoreductase alpha subunit